MSKSFDTFFVIWDIFAVILILLGVPKYALRRKYVEEINQYPSVHREKIFKASTRVTKLAKIFLWLSPLYLIFVPLAFHYYAELDLWISIVSMMLLVTLVVQEFLFEQWILKHIQANEPPQNNET